MDTRLETQLNKEIAAINRTLAAFRIDARTRQQLTGIGGDQLIIYRLKRKPEQAISEIEKRLPELSEAISEARRQQTMVRLLQRPVRLEVTHPYRKPLAWRIDAITGQPNQLLLGRTYDDGARDLWLSLADVPHLLVAGGTGSGKSVSMMSMVLSLCWNTSPADLRVALVDLKNTDFKPLVRLPHVDVLATDIELAANVFSNAGELLRTRQTNSTDHPRLMILVDEYTDLIVDADTMEHADRIARQGRSAGIHMLIATQHPTSKALGGATIKNNFLTRIVGQVADASAAHNAAGRPGTHAELLPGKGSFLMVRGMEVSRYQSYFLTHVDIESLITRISRRWREVDHKSIFAPLAPVQVKSLSSLVYAPPAPPHAPVHAPPLHHLAPVQNEQIAPLFPLPEMRQLTAQEAAAVREMAADSMSKNGICNLVYGSKSTRYMAWINEALAEQPAQDDNKIIQLRRAS